MVSISLKMVKYIKVNSQIIKSLGLVYKSIQMVIYTWVNFKMEKSMVMDDFSGLISQVKTQNKINMFNVMMDNGGVVYLMDKEFIKELMVIFYRYFR